MSGNLNNSGSAGNTPPNTAGGSTTSGIVTTTSAPRQLSDGNALFGGPGVEIGFAGGDKLGFFGATPVQQPGNGTLVGTVLATGNVTIYGQVQSPGAVGANTAGEQAMSVPGILATDAVFVEKPTAQPGLIVGTARVSAASTVALMFGNVTGSPITPTGGETYAFITFSAGLQTTSVLSPAAVPANTVSEQVFTVPGVSVSQTVFVNKPTPQIGLIIVNCRASGNNQVAIQFENVTSSPITPTPTETYTFASASGFQVAPIMNVFTQLLTPVSVAANTSAEQTFTVPGLVVGTKVAVTKESVTPGLSLAGARVSAANTLAVNFANNTAAPIVPPPEVYMLSVFTAAAGNTTGTSLVLAAAKGNSAGAMAALGLTTGY